MPQVAYDPTDPAQQSFLSALALGEVGTGNAYQWGVGSTADKPIVLSGAPEYPGTGFPIWPGWGGSHAAGEFQIEPQTWNPVAVANSLNFQNPADQNAGAWYIAQQRYAAANNGASLETALQEGRYASIQDALASTWPTVTGGANTAAPAGLAADLAGGVGSGAISNAGTASPGSSGSSPASFSPNPFDPGNLARLGQHVGQALSNPEDILVRAGLIAIGGILVIVALWKLLEPVATGAASAAEGASSSIGRVKAAPGRIGKAVKKHLPTVAAVTAEAL